MLILDILQIPIEFIKENLTGWVLLIIAVFIIYFICLRKYYIQREKFYDAGSQIKTLEEVESTEDNIKQNYDTDADADDATDDTLETEQSITNTRTNTSNSKNSNNRHKNLRDSRKEYKKERVVLKNSDRVDDKFNQDNSKAASRNTNSKKGKQVLEGFESIISHSPSTESTMPVIATTLFDNLNLNLEQINACKSNYNQVIAQLITELGKLTNMANKNPYLNTKKQFDSILAKGVDNIMNHLTITIKSPRILTRTAIRTDVIRAMNTTLENLIDKTNNELTSMMNKLAMMNSTTIDYNSQLSSINESRAQLEKYIQIDKLINQLGHNVSISQREVSSILDKSFILPIYERNFDKIAQIAKSDFNGDEGNMAMKYSKAYMNFVEQQKKEELDINPLSLASKIESGIVSMLSSIGESKTNKPEIKTSPNILGEYAASAGELREQLTRDYGFTNSEGRGISKVVNNPIPKQEASGGLLSQGDAFIHLNKDNIFSDGGNRGSYLIDRKVQKDVLEGFEDSTTTSPSTTSPNLIKAFDDSKTKSGIGISNNKTKKDDISGLDLPSKLLSGDFLQYMLDTINGYMTGGYGTYKDKINSYLGGMGVGMGVGGDVFKLEDNMIPAGFALFILSMLLYFVDITS